MSFPTYAHYKDSGVEWLGEVPAHWSLHRLKNICSVFPSNVDKKSYADEIPVKLCNYTDVYYNEVIIAGMDFMLATASADQIEKFSLRCGDTIITKDSETADDIAIASYVPKNLEGIVCGYHLSMIRPLNLTETNGAFIKRVFDTHFTKAQCAVSANGLTRVGLGQYAIDNIAVPVPPFFEQNSIVDFLDRETTKLDALITEQRTLIDLLKEKRQAVISHAVTKGLDPRVPMKDSGVEWLGEVPAHWEAASLKRYWSVTDCKHITAEFVEDGIPLASIREVQSRFVKLDDAKKTTSYFYEQLIEGDRCPRPGDLIFSRNATVGEVAKVAEWHPPFAMGQDVCLLRCLSPEYSSDYLQMILKSSVVVEQLANIMIGSTFKRVNVEDIRNIVVSMPPPHEQTKIAEYVLLEAARIDDLTAEAQTTIALLQERRSALISAAVTGKIDVRQHATEAA